MDNALRVRNMGLARDSPMEMFCLRDLLLDLLRQLCYQRRVKENRCAYMH